MPRREVQLFPRLRGVFEPVAHHDQRVAILLAERLEPIGYSDLGSGSLLGLPRRDGVNLNPFRCETRRSSRLEHVADRAPYVEEPALGGAVRDHRAKEPLELVERRAVLFDVLARLPETERLLIVFKEIEGLPLSEISTIVDLPEGTIKSKLHRTRCKMVKMIEGETA